MRATDGRRRGERGFTLVEVLVAVLIVATTISVLQTISGATLKTAVETNRIRIAKMLLRQKAEEIAAGVETSSGGGFDGFPGYEWESSDVETPVTTDDGSGNQPEAVRTITVTVRMPSLAASPDEFQPDPNSTEDGPGVMRVTTLLDPVNAQLQPPQAQGGAPGAPGAPAGGGGGR